MTNQTNVRDFESAAEFLKHGRDKNNRPLEYETRLVRRDEDQIAVKLFETDVVTYHADGSVTLDSGGWLTVTTKTRMNDYQNLARVWQEDGVWYVAAQPWRFGWDTGQADVFADGVRIFPDGSVQYEGEAPREPSEIAQLTAKINDYAHGFAEALVAGDVPKPSGADCWLCHLGDDGDTDHLRSHMDESYFVPSLLLNAISEGNTAPLFNQLVWDAFGKGTDRWGAYLDDTTYRLVRDYLKRKFEIAT